jgi:hypothetical protein
LISSVIMPYGAAMADDAGRLRFGAGQGKIALLTARDGLAAQVGHDLTIEITQWSAELVVADDHTPAGLTARAELNSLVVREGTGGVKPLTDKDRREIAVTARRLLRTDRHSVATFTASRFEPGQDGGGAAAAPGRQERRAGLPRDRVGAAIGLRHQAVHRVPRRAQGQRRRQDRRRRGASR